MCSPEGGGHARGRDARRRRVVRRLLQLVSAPRAWRRARRTAPSRVCSRCRCSGRSACRWPAAHRVGQWRGRQWRAAPVDGCDMVMLPKRCYQGIREQRSLSSPGSRRSKLHVERHRGALRSTGRGSASATRLVASHSPGIELESQRDACFEAMCQRARLSF